MIQEKPVTLLWTELHGYLHWCVQTLSEVGLPSLFQKWEGWTRGIKVLVSISMKADKDQNLGWVDFSIPYACRPIPHHGSTLDPRDYIPQAPLCSHLGMRPPKQWLYPGLGILLLLRVQILGLGNTTYPLLGVELCLPNRQIEVLISPTASLQNVTLFENRSVKVMY